MGRARKKGMDCFSVDVDLFRDIRIRKLVSRRGGEAVTVYMSILCEIYRSGYYLAWDDDTAFVLSELARISEDNVRGILEDCLSIGLFSGEMFYSSHVLTSRDIQTRYLATIPRSRRISAIGEFSLMSGDDMAREGIRPDISAEEIAKKTDFDGKNGISAEEIAKKTDFDGKNGISAEEIAKKRESRKEKEKRDKKKEREIMLDNNLDLDNNNNNNLEIFLKEKRMQREKKGDTRVGAMPRAPDYDAIGRFFNEETAGAFGKVTIPLVDSYREQVRARVSDFDRCDIRQPSYVVFKPLKDKGMDGVGAVYEAIRKVARSDFLHGGNQSGWVMGGFDWLMNKNNFVKILRCDYDGRRDRIDFNGEDGGISERFLRNVAEGIARGNHERGGR